MAAERSAPTPAVPVAMPAVGERLAYGRTRKGTIEHARRARARNLFIYYWLLTRPARRDAVCRCVAEAAAAANFA